jgi:integral membrane protein
MLQTPIGRVRAIGAVEAVSFLVLLCVAMPLKYLADMPGAVQIVGWGHGILFLLLCAALGHAWSEGRLTPKQAAMVFVAALLPCGPFFLDKRLRQWERSAPM